MPIKGVVKNYFSIRYKILIVITALLVSCVAVYLLLATHVFKTDKTELIYDLNKSIVSNLATDIDTEFSGIASKLELLTLTWGQKNQRLQKQLEELLIKDPFIVYVAIVKDNSKSHQVQFSRPEFVDEYSLSETFFTYDLEKLKPSPLLEIQQAGEAVWNASVPGGPPLLGYGRSVIEEGPGEVPVARHNLITYLKVDPLIRSLTSSRNSDVFLVNKLGQILLHPDAKRITEGTDTSKLEIVSKALEPQAPKTSVMRYAINEHYLLGAYSKSYHDQIIVVANSSEDQAFLAARQLMRRSLVFATAIATFAFIVAVLFSQTLTRPIQKLVAGMEKVSRGDLNTQIDVSSKDEISIMAQSFNSMINDLKESRNELEAINRDLEQKVLDRTKMLEEQNRAVKDAQEALLRTTRLAAVGEIAGRAAHEVLNPLTNILTRLRKIQEHLIAPLSSETELLNEIQSAWIEEEKSKGLNNLVTEWKRPSTIMLGKSLWDEDMDNLKQVYQNWKKATSELISDTEFLLDEGQRINKIVSQMRSLSVVRADKQPHSIHSLLTESIKIMGDLTAREKIRVLTNFEASQDVALVDRDEFIQSTVNLIKNSIQAIVESGKVNGDGKIMVSTVVRKQEIQVNISDNGIGIDPKNQEKLFTTQFTTKSHQDGTGLGLSISRRLVRACGGDINFVESSPNQKTTFAIVLPLNTNSEQAGAA